MIVEQPEKPKKEEEPNENTDNSAEVQKLNFKEYRDFSPSFRSSEIELPEGSVIDVQKYKNQNARSSKTELQKVQTLNPNYTNINYTENSYTNLIYPSIQEEKKEDKMDEIDRAEEVSAYITLIKENIDYEYLVKQGIWNDKELYEELFEVICEVVCVKRDTVRIGGEDYPYELVKSKFLRLNSGHLEYVMHCMKNTTTKISNIKAYMLTALYNAPNTINHYYQQEVKHDMYGGGWREKGVI